MKRILKILILAALLCALIVPSALASSFSAIVTADSMKVYGDSDLFEILGTLSKDTVITVNSYEDNVALITYRGHSGYASVSDLTAVSSVAKSATIGSNTRVYASPSTKAKSVKVSAGTTVNLLSVSGSWARIEANGYVAYIKTTDLTTVEPVATPEPTAKLNTDVVECDISATVSSSKLTVYKSASTKGKKLGTLTKGIVVTVRAYNKTWAYIEYNGHYGYCKLSGLAKTPDATVAPTAAPTATPTAAPTATVKPTATPVPASTKKPSTNYTDSSLSNEQIIFNFLRNECGMNAAGACGVLANMRSESNFKPTALNKNSGAFGISQWTSSRKSALISFCEKNGYDKESLIGQLYYLKYELDNKYTGILNYMRGVDNTADGAYDAGWYWDYYFARSNNKAVKAVQRGNVARETYWPKYCKQ